ncbi:hypothetical protein [Flexivirga oryzae]|uniref:Uncharacterized protein n=1 Tax=Flexivirga oryzae TaxID=1794944 RepID=A0A839N7I6_9MICO|nr:hypothetical protein [Flexivirga oryzae]MBB2891185.1 hypothetical protein [Flexivirga oryzae]
MTESSSRQLQTDAAEAILRRIPELAPDANAAELSALADAYSSVAIHEDEEFDPSLLQKWAFDQAAQYVDFEVVEDDDEDEDED